MPHETQLILVDQIEPLIHEVRGQKVILDSDLAKLYGVTTKRLNEQVQRNLTRFPDDFLFRLTTNEAAALRSQIATLLAEADCSLKYQAALRLNREWVALVDERFGWESGVLVWVFRQ